MPNTPRAEWRRRQAFHEFAEALGVGTDHVIAVRSVDDHPGEFVALFSLDPEDRRSTYAAILCRDAVGILREVEGRRRHLPRFWDNLPSR